MSNQPQDPKTRSIELLEHLVDSSEAQTAIISDLVNELHNLAAFLTSAAQVISAGQTAPAQVRVDGSLQVQDFDATAILMSYNEKTGEPVYKITGFPFSVYGVRVWPEILPALNIDPDTLKPGPNLIQIRVRAMMVESGTTGKLTPKKVIGLAPE